MKRRIMYMIPESIIMIIVAQTTGYAGTKYESMCRTGESNCMKYLITTIDKTAIAR